MNILLSFHAFFEPFWKETELLFCLIFLYALPLLRLITAPVSFRGRLFLPIARILGTWERLISPLRKTFGIIFLATALLWFSIDGFSFSNTFSLTMLPIILFLFALTWYAHEERRRSVFRFLEFVSSHPPMHPREFFALLASLSSPLRYQFQKPVTVVVPHSVDFRKKGGTFFHFPLLSGLFSTMTLARMLMLSSRVKGKTFLHKVAPATVMMWGLRILYLTRSALTVEGVDRLQQKPRYALYLFNHESFLEFAIAPLVLGTRLPRFLLAKDHFRDNPLLYRFLGIGKVAEALDMVFVDRSKVKTKEEKILRARKISKETVKKLLDDHIPLALFPQGTRARSTVTVDGKRLGAGYYTAGKHDRLSIEGGHIKKGVAYIAINAAIELQKRKSTEPVTFIPIGVTGAAVVCPRKSFRVHYGVTIHLRVEQPLLITPDMVRKLKLPERDDLPSHEYQEEINDLLKRIDRSLVLALKLHGELEGRFLELVRERRDPNMFEEIFVALREWQGKEDNLLYVILDYIFATHPSKWRPFTNQLMYLLLSQAPREQFVELKQAVADDLCQIKKKETYRRLNFRTVS